MLTTSAQRRPGAPRALATSAALALAGVCAVAAPALPSAAAARPAATPRAAAAKTPSSIDAPAPTAGPRPFVLEGSASNRALALRCLAQAVYYEAGDQSADGQAAVAQTVLNRVRHPAFPKSVCGVVYEGAELRDGCQFSFTCNGSLTRAPDAAGWARALWIARRALGGYVDRSVGWATHYHADYVDPDWRRQLVRLTQIGAHIFYRWAGPEGSPAAYVGRYDGHESYAQPILLSWRARGPDLRTTAAGLLAPAPETLPIVQPPRTVVLGSDGAYVVKDDADPAPTAEAIAPSRPHPTAAQVGQIDAQLEARFAARP